MTVNILVGDALETLRTMEAESVHCCITSPPYFGLRDYGVSGQMGLEETPEQFIAGMVEVFREVRRVLRDDGTCWVNMGDSYVSTPPGTRGKHAKNEVGDGNYSRRWDRQLGQGEDKTRIYKRPANLKPKDLMGMPWRLALALQADGWWLRSDIIWAKPNPMPESVTDRPTKAHEYVFLLTKAARYFYDADAVREGGAGRETFGNTGHKQGVNEDRNDGGRQDMSITPGRNRRTVWTIATQPFSAAHFATFPTKLVEPMIKAGTSEKGCCPECGGPWERVIEKTGADYKAQSVIKTPKAKAGINPIHTKDGKNYIHARRGTNDWRPTCDCCQICDIYNNADHKIVGAGEPCEPYAPIPCTVLDIFAGACTVGLVADRLGRDAIMIELNPEYAEMGRRRIADDAGWVTEVEVQETAVQQMELF